MANVPETSTTLLSNVRDAEHPRWPEFVAKYRPMMEAYLNAHFPTLEADDVIQETFAALCSILPSYIYDPDHTIVNLLRPLYRLNLLTKVSHTPNNIMVKKFTFGVKIS